ncbi:hypothetical protein MMC16_004853 [Acarospora aff. strigata]|nr:hypothetical protein [Acarospora aff. strigata]
MPYKAIAAHLHKTDLACRLHYHQLGIPNGRPKRTLSVSSSSVASQSSLSVSQPPTPEMTRSSSPPVKVSDGPGRQSPISHEIASVTASPPHHDVTILPKPASMPYQRWNALRLDTVNLSADEEQSKPEVDEGRLRLIYETHRSRFWSQVAADYGSNIAPATLEKAWGSMSTAAVGTYPLPTPCVSPQSDVAAPSVLNLTVSALSDHDGPRGFCAINVGSAACPTSMVAEKSAFPISSLLTEEKEVRSSTRRD